MITTKTLDDIRNGRPLHDDESACTLWYSDVRQAFVITGRGNSFVIPGDTPKQIRRHVAAFSGV